MTTTFMTNVRAMRDAQKRYFKTRDRNDLLTSKDLERKVDTLIADAEKAEQELIAGERRHHDD
jgi:hypothetical protein